MLEDVNYWLSLVRSKEYDLLELELEQYQVTLMPPLEPEDIPTLSLDEAFDIAEGYTE
jgi:hypothetical protein